LGGRVLLIVLTILSVAAFPVWCHFSPPAWDTLIYYKAVQSIAIGHDPYADGIAAQQLAHALDHGVPSQQGPFSYVYSPITLPILRAVAATPVWLAAAIYFLLYLAGVGAEMWFGFRALNARDPHEYNSLLPVLPLAVFFPGLLASDTILSGNVAFLLYGLALATALYAWRTSRWLPFYLAVLAASCVKAPLLCLLAIPVFSARRQWIPAALTAAAGVALFAGQPLVWPTLFRHYLQAVELQFSYNRDFGFSPTGLFSGLLWDHHIPYSPGSALFYLLYAIPICATLFSLSRRFLRDEFSRRQWAPLLLVGVILLNPRLIEYDAAPLALPMAILFWRFFARLAPRHTLLCFCAFFLTANAVALISWSAWKLTEGPMLMLAFAAGAWNLATRTPSVSSHNATHEQELLPTLLDPTPTSSIFQF